MIRSILLAACCIFLATPASAARTTVAAAPFDGIGEAPAWIGLALADALNSRVSNQVELNALTLRQVEAAMRQLRVEARHLGDPQHAADLGRQLGADLIVTGDYGLRDGRVGISIRVLDTASVTVRAWQKRTWQSSDLIAAEQDLAVVVAKVLGISEPAPVAGAFGTRDLTAWESATRAMSILSRQSLSPRAADPLAPPALTAEQLEEASTLVRQAIAADPAYGRAWALLAIVETIAGDAATGWTTLGKATANGAGDDAMTVLAGAFIRLRTGRVDDAVSILRAAINRRPGLLHARGNLGHLYNHYGRFRESRATFRSYAEVAPRQPWVLAQIGYANARLGKRDQAIADTEAALKLLPDSPYLRLELASRYIDAKKLGEAATTLEQILEKFPDEARVYVRLGYVQLLQGKYEEAIASANRALLNATSPRHRRDRIYARLNLARAHGHLGELEIALQHLTQAKADGLSNFSEIENDPKLEKMRADARYVALTEE